MLIKKIITQEGISSMSCNKLPLKYQSSSFVKLEDEEMHLCRLRRAVIFQPLLPLFSHPLISHQGVLRHLLYHHFQHLLLHLYYLGLPFRTPLGTGTVMLYSRSGAVLEKVAMETMSSPMST